MRIITEFQINYITYSFYTIVLKKKQLTLNLNCQK